MSAAVLLASDMGVERTGLILYDADLVNVVRRMGITFSVDRKRVAIDTILARVHSELPGPYAVLSSVPDVIGICLPINPDVNSSSVTITPTTGSSGATDGATGVLTSSFDSLDMDSAGSYTISTPGAAFQFSQTYQGPGMTNQTIIQRTTVIESVTDTTSVFTQ